MARGLAVVVAAVAVWAAATVAVRLPDPLYRLDAVDVALVAAAALLLAAGATGLARSARPDVAALTLVAATLTAVGMLALFSIGVLLLAAALVPGAVLARRLLQRRDRAGRAAAAGVAAALGLGVVLLAWPHGPFIDCGPDGASTTGRWRDGSGATRVEVGPDGVVQGTVRFDDEAYRFRCGPDGEVVELERLR